MSGLVARLKRGSAKPVMTRRRSGIAILDCQMRAVQEQRLLITMDKDFGELVYHSNQLHAGVLLLRSADAASDEKLAIVAAITQQFGAQLPGRFSVYQDGRLRIR